MNPTVTELEAKIARILTRLAVAHWDGELTSAPCSCDMCAEERAARTVNCTACERDNLASTGNHYYGALCDGCAPSVLRF